MWKTYIYKQNKGRHTKCNKYWHTKFDKNNKYYISNLNIIMIDLYNEYFDL